MQADDATRKRMTEFCLREAKQHDDCVVAYRAALSSAAHLCDQVAREATTAARRESAKACGDLIWSVYEQIAPEVRNQ